MAYESLPGVRASFPDGGLTVQQTTPYGDSILVIGTSEDGPKYNPVPIHSLDQATDIFGKFGVGNLIRGVYEVWNATNQPVDVRAMRIGNGAPASVGVPEASGYITYEFASAGTNIYGAAASGLADPTFSASGRLDQFIDAVTLTAKYDGSAYNSFTIRDGYASVTGQRAIVLYNPFTGMESSYTYDYYNTTNTSVDIHDVIELVDAINADSNINPYVSATTTDLTAIYEVCASGNSSDGGYIVPASGAYNGTYYLTSSIPNSLRNGSAIETVWNDDGTPKKVTLNLHHITTADDNDGDGIPDSILCPDPNYGIPSVIKVGPVGVTWGRNVQTAGNQLIELAMVYDIADASGELLPTAGRDYAELDNYPINRNSSQASTGVNGETIISYLGDNLNTSEYRQYVSNGLIGVSTDGTTSVFTFRAKLEPDVNYYAGGSTNIPNYTHDHTTIGQILKTRIYETVSGVTSETRKPVTLAWSAGVATVTFTDSDQLPSAGTIITIDYISVVGTLTEYGTRTALENTRGTTDAEENYFVTGNSIYFAGAHDTDIMVTYQYRRDYDIPGDVSISNSTIGAIEFTNPAKQPQIHSAGGTRIGVNYTYKPEWVSLPGTLSLAGGGNGTNMTNKQLKSELDEAYSALENYEIDILVPMGAYLDSTMEDYSPETGILREVNAGFHTQLAALLDILAGNVNETIGIIGVKPANTNSLSDVKTWVEKLTVADANDRLRAANYMPVFASRWVQVVAAEPIISAATLGISSSDYYGDGTTVYAGLIASLSSQIATTNKFVGRGLSGLRYSLSSKQLNDLVSNRYVCFQNKPRRGIVVVKDVTAAAPGSDYDKLTTIRIVKLVMDVVRDVSEPYIGDVNTAYKRNAMYTAINKSLGAMTSASNQILRDYEFTIAATAEEQRLGIVNVQMTLVPVFCTERVLVTVRLRNTL